MEMKVLEKLVYISGNHWSNSIVDFIKNECKTDEVLASKVLNQDKTILGLSQYVLKRAKKLQRHENVASASDEEVFGWSIHYFMESNEEIEKEVGSTNENVKVKAVKQATKKKPKESDKTEEYSGPSLFDYLDDENNQS